MDQTKRGRGGKAGTEAGGGRGGRGGAGGGGGGRGARGRGEAGGRGGRGGDGGSGGRGAGQGGGSEQRDRGRGRGRGQAAQAAAPAHQRQAAPQPAAAVPPTPQPTAAPAAGVAAPKQGRPAAAAKATAAASGQKPAWTGGAPPALTLSEEQKQRQDDIARARADAKAEAEAEAEQREQVATAAVEAAARIPSPRLRSTPDEEVQGMVTRPTVKSPRMGSPITVMCNHFPFALRAPGFYQYSVEFKPEVESKGLRFYYMDQFKDVLGVSYIFDGAILFLTKQMSDTELRAKGRDDSEIRVTINFIKQLPHASLQLSGLIFRKILRMLKLKPIGRQYYDPTRPIDIPQHRVQLWPGYFISITPNQKGIMLVADVAHKVLRTDTVLDFLGEAAKTKRGTFREFVTEQLLGSIVVTRYNNRTYRIDGIEWNMNPCSKFMRRSGEQITYIEYYRSTYNRSMITDLDQPLLLHRHRRRGADDELIYLIPELCSMTGLTDAMRQDFTVMKDLAEHTRVGPAKRKIQVDDFIATINKHPEVREKLVEGWGLSINTVTPAVPARVLDAQKLFFGNTQQSLQVDSSSEWMNASAKNRVLSSIVLKNWLFIFHNQLERQAEDFLLQISRVGQDVGLNVAPPSKVPLPDNKASSYVRSAKERITDETQVVVFLITGTRKDTYDQMKKLCCLDMPIPSQAILSKSLNPKKIASVCKNILLQINCKQGGELWRVDIPLPQHSMVVGIDVYHDTTPGGRRSVAGFIASTNATFTKYYSRVVFQGQGQELVDRLRVCMVDSLKHFFKVNKALPDRIFIYRDGVGDGQLAAVMEQEVPQIREAFTQISPEYKPKLAFVVVKKRIHTRIFARGARGLCNPPPGTVVDSDVVHPSWYDFFLVSQYVRQGTVTPTHYHVIIDNTGLTVDQMQVLTYKLCHLYFNWSGTIRVPAPCQYAHKIAFLVGQSIHKEPNISLADRLYFL